MKNILLAVLVMAISTVTYAKKDKSELKIDISDVIQIETVAIAPDGSFFTVGGTLIGLTTAPKGDYQVEITNGKKFKGETYSEMKCQILPLQEIKYAKSVPLATSFVVEGKLYNAMGFFSGADVFPSEGYKTTVTNGKSRAEWNSMKCKIN